MKSRIRSLALAALVLSALLLPAIAAAAGQAIGCITRIQAGVGIDGKEAALGDQVFSGTTLTTAANGRVEVVFSDTTRLIVGGDSTFVVTNFEYEYGEDHKVEKAFFQLVKGAFRMVTSELIDNSPDAFGVNTPLAVVGIRGTDFWAGYLSPEEIDIVMLAGKGVVVTSMGGVTEISEPGQGVSVPDPIRHPLGFGKALLPPEISRWSPEKLARATSTVAFE